MKKVLKLLQRTLAIVVVVGLVYSCKKEKVEKIEIDNQFAISVFSDTIKISDFLNNLDSLVLEYIKVTEDGSIYACYSDTVENAVVASDVLSGLDDIIFETSNEFEMPTIPPSPVPIPVELPLDDIFSLPFEYDGYEINSVMLKSGDIKLDFSTNLNIDGKMTLTTDEIKMSDGSDFSVEINLNNTGTQSINIDLTNCSITPVEDEIHLSAVISATLSEGLGGMYHFNLNGGIKDVEFKSIDGSVQPKRYDFIGTEEIHTGFPNLYGDLKIVTPEFSVKYINTFGFAAQGFIDSLYLTDADGNLTTVIEDWDCVELELYSTDDYYGVINDLDDQLVDEFDLLDDYKEIFFMGNVLLGSDNITNDMISEDSHIDIIADLELPLEFNIDNLLFMDTLDFDLNLSSGMNSEEDQSIHVENIFDEIEFKFVFENSMPIMLKPQVYMLENDQVIDSLFDGNDFIHACENGIAVEDVVEVLLTGESLLNIQKANKISLKIGLSSLGKDVSIKSSDFFKMRLGLRTKTTEIYMDDINL